MISAFMLPGGIVQPIFGNQIMVHLGNISFELFIVHQVLITIFNHIINGVLHNNGMYTCFVLFFGSLVVADTIHRLMDGKNIK